MAGTPWHWIQSHIEACRQGLGLNGFGQIGDRSLFEQSSFNLGRLSISRLDVVHGQHFTNNSSMASPQVRLAEDQHPVQALASHGANQTLDIRILPRRSGRDRSVTDGPWLAPAS